MFVLPGMPEAPAVGIVTFTAPVIMSASFYLKRFIGQKGWRNLHYLLSSSSAPRPWSLRRN
jgi:hypothetical protein